MSGVPGCGKTFVMEELAANGHGLFLVSDDPTRVAQGIRSQRPTRIFVDDAHFRLQDLGMLRRLREDLGIPFVVIASCWPGRVQEVTRELATPQTSNTLRELRLLTMAEIADVIRSCGIAVEDTLLRELIDQSAGKPGLAVTLANLILRSELQQIASATALLHEIAIFKDLVGTEALEVLASFALGGGSGMTASSVADYLELPPVAIRQMLGGLAAGGVLREVTATEPAFAVEPRPLRHSLVAEVFFRGATALPAQPLVDDALRLGDVVSTLVGAKHRSGQVPDGLIQELLLRTSDESAWVHYAALGPAQVRWILHHRPDTVRAIARVGLFSAPQEIVPRLLYASTGNHLSLPQHPDHPLRILQDWAKSGHPGTGDAVTRRRLVLTATEDYSSDQKSDPWVVLRALATAFDPRYENTAESVTDPLSIQMSFGILTEPDMSALGALWDRAAPVLAAVNITELDPLRELVHHWLHPGGPGSAVAPELTVMMADIARTMVRTIVTATSTNPGIASWAAQLSDQHGWDLTFATDPEYDVLFPIDSFGPTWRETRDAAHQVARSLATDWCQRSPEDVAPRLRLLYDAAQVVGHRGLECGSDIARWIAEDTDQPVQWLESLIAHEAPVQFVSPFLAASIRQAPNSVTTAWRRCIESQTYRTAVVEVAFGPDPVPHAFLDTVLDQLPGSEHIIEWRGAQGHLDEDRLRLLLTHSSDSIRAAITHGLWLGDRAASLSSDLSDAWRRSIVKDVDNHILESVFRSDPTTALEWLLHRTRSAHPPYWLPNESLEVAIDVLSTNQRRRVLHSLDKAYERLGQDTLIRMLIGTNPELYRELLQDRSLKQYHLAPLRGYPEDPWQTLAGFALEAGYTPDELAHACRLGGGGWTGKLSDMEATWMERFEALADHTDPRLREVGILGRRAAEKEMKHHLKREHREQVFGL